MLTIQFPCLAEAFLLLETTPNIIKVLGSLFWSQ